jgi:hypothetical protein
VREADTQSERRHFKKRGDEKIDRIREAEGKQGDILKYI